MAYRNFATLAAAVTPQPCDRGASKAPRAPIYTLRDAPTSRAHPIFDAERQTTLNDELQTYPSRCTPSRRTDESKPGHRDCQLGAGAAAGLATMAASRSPAFGVPARGKRSSTGAPRTTPRTLPMGSTRMGSTRMGSSKLLFTAALVGARQYGWRHIVGNTSALAPRRRLRDAHHLHDACRCEFVKYPRPSGDLVRRLCLVLEENDASSPTPQTSTKTVVVPPSARTRAGTSDRAEILPVGLGFAFGLHEDGTSRPTLQTSAATVLVRPRSAGVAGTARRRAARARPARSGTSRRRPASRFSEARRATSAPALLRT